MNRTIEPTENRGRPAQYDAAFREQAVSLLEESTRSINALASELGVSHISRLMTAHGLQPEAKRRFVPRTTHSIPGGNTGSSAPPRPARRGDECPAQQRHQRHQQQDECREHAGTARERSTDAS